MRLYSAFYTGNYQFQGDEVGIPHQNLLSPFNRDYPSPFSAFSPVPEVAIQKESDSVSDGVGLQQKMVKDKISFDDSEMSEEESKTPERTKPKLPT